MSVQAQPYAYITFYLKLQEVKTKFIGKTIIYLTEEQWKNTLGKKGPYIFEILNERIKYEPWYGIHEIEIYSYYSEMLTPVYTFQWKKHMNEKDDDFDLYINDFSNTYKCKIFESMTKNINSE
jgi:hypothetical protein